MNDRDLIALGVSPDTAQSGGSRRVRKRTSEHEISPTGEAASGGARRQRNSFFGRSKPQNIQHEGGQRRARSFFFRRSNSDDSDYADELDAENDRDNQQEDFDPTPDDVSTMFGDDVSRMTAGANPDYPAAGYELSFENSPKSPYTATLTNYASLDLRGLSRRNTKFSMERREMKRMAKEISEILLLRRVVPICRQCRMLKLNCISKSFETFWPSSVLNERIKNLSPSPMKVAGMVV